MQARPAGARTGHDLGAWRARDSCSCSSVAKRAQTETPTPPEERGRLLRDETMDEALLGVPAPAVLLAHVLAHRLALGRAELAVAVGVVLLQALGAARRPVRLHRRPCRRPARPGRS